VLTQLQLFEDKDATSQVESFSPCISL
jgi:hypothetical protein